jgi:hypothetical protein
VDAGRVYDALRRDDPVLLSKLSAPRSAMFGGATGHLGSVFTTLHSGRVVVRFRDDPLVRFRPDIAERLPALRSNIDRHTITLRLEAGQGLLFSNSRWLHGRTAYTGSRRIYRIAGNMLPPYEIPPGFLPFAFRRKARSL